AELVSAAADPSGPVCLLLLARSAGEWWERLQALLRPSMRVESSPLALPPLEDSVAGRRSAYAEAVEDLAAGLTRMPDRGAHDWPAIAARCTPPDLSDPPYGSILTLQLQALTDLLSGAAGTAGSGPGPADVLLEHEQL